MVFCETEYDFFLWDDFFLFSLSLFFFLPLTIGSNERIRRAIGSQRV